MAYINQDMKKKLAPGIKAVLKKYGIKGSIAVKHHSELVVTLREGNLDLISGYERKTGQETGGYVQVNQYYISRDFPGIMVQFLEELQNAMDGRGADIGNWDRSDSMTDYFDVGWYISIQIGRWDKPYRYIGSTID